MDPKALYQISYGLYIVSSINNGKLNGQIANTVFQISNDPVTIAVSINKKNLTNEFIKKSKYFSVSVLAREAQLSLIGQFGFKSGRETNKFEGVGYKLSDNGIPYVTDGTLAYLEARVTQEVNAATHCIFIGEVVGAEVIRPGEPMTYAYYQAVKKGSVPKTAPLPQLEPSAGISYVCNICGYVYEPAVGDPENSIAAGTAFEELPDSWTCPVCGAGKDAFESA